MAGLCDPCLLCTDYGPGTALAYWTTAVYVLLRLLLIIYLLSEVFKISCITQKMAFLQFCREIVFLCAIKSVLLHYLEKLEKSGNLEIRRII